MQTRSTHLLPLSLAVGVFGAAAGRLFTWVTFPHFGFDFGLPAYAYAWISPLVLFASAASTFALTFGVLKSTRGRARRSGLVSGVLTYVCHAAWIAGFAGYARDVPVLFVFLGSMAFFVVIGWVPMVSGWLAGWCVERWLGNKPAVVDEHHPSPRYAGLMFGLLCALVSLPLIFLLMTVARRSHLDVPVFIVTAPFVVFGLAAVAFRLWVLVPIVARHPSIAGALAAVMAFACFLVWTRFAVNIYNGGMSGNSSPWPSPLAPFITAFALTGWVPLVFGALAGGWVSGWLSVRPKVA